MHRRIFLVIAIAICTWWILPAPSTLANSTTTPNDRFAQLFAQGETAMRSGDYAKAVGCYQQALAFQSAQPRVLYRLAQAELGAGQHMAAFGHISQVVAATPSNLEARVVAAECLQKLGRSNEAQQQLAWVLKVQPDHARARQLMASVPTGRATNAPKVAATPTPGARVTPPATTDPRRKAAPSRLSTAPTASPNPVQAAVAPTSAATPQSAATVDTESAGTWQVPDFLRRGSDSYGIQIEYGKYCLEKDDLDKAATSLAAAERIALSGRDTRRFLEVQIHQALLALYRTELDEFGKRILKLQPLLGSDTYQSFLDTYTKATKAPGELDRLRLIAGVAMGAEHYAVAIRLTRQVLEKDGADSFALRLLAQAYIETRQMDLAEQAFFTLVRHDPKDIENFANLARFYMTAKYHPPTAYKFAEQLIRVTPSDPRGPLFRGMALIGMGNLPEGMKQLQIVANHATLKGEIPDLAKRMVAEANIMTKMNEEARRIHFARLIALPGSKAGGAQALTALGDEMLSRGSYFAAFRTFIDAKNLPEIGRTYLAMASRLASIGDDIGAAVATEFGLSALHMALQQNPNDGHAHLFLAIYHRENHDDKTANQHIASGLSTPTDAATKRRLQALKAGQS